jgi:hypothetical protein
MEAEYPTGWAANTGAVDSWPDEPSLWPDPAALRAMMGGPAGALLDRLLRRAGRRLIGRRFAVPGTGGDLVLRLDAVRARPDPLSVALGQFGDVGVGATEVEWRGTPIRRLDLDCRNVHVRPTGTAVAAPVTLEVAVGIDVVRDLVAARRPAVRIDAGASGQARVAWSHRPETAAVHVVPEVAGSALHLRPVVVEVGSHRFRLPGWLPPVRITLPELPRGLRLREVEPGVDEVVARFVAGEWAEELPTSPLLDLFTMS